MDNWTDFQIHNLNETGGALLREARKSISGALDVSVALRADGSWISQAAADQIMREGYKWFGSVWEGCLQARGLPTPVERPAPSR